MSRFRPWWLLAIALLATACEVPTNDEPVALSGPFARLETTTTTSTISPAAATKQVVVWMLRTESGATVLQEIPRSVDVEAGIDGILANLFTQPPSPDIPAEVGLESAIPASATLLSAQRSAAVEGRLVVDVRGLFGDQGGVQGPRLRNALAQIVYTATQQGTGVSEVVFRNDGEPASALVDDLQTTSDPVRRTDYSRRID